METTITRLVETKKLNTTLWNIAAQQKTPPVFYFDSVVDVAMLLIVERKSPKVVHYLDEHVALLYHPDTKEIIGLQIEAFKKSFLPLYGELQKAWRLSDNCKDLTDLGDMMIRVHKQEKMVAKEISTITRPAFVAAGLELPALV